MQSDRKTKPMNEIKPRFMKSINYKLQNLKKRQNIQL